MTKLTPIAAKAVADIRAADQAGAIEFREHPAGKVAGIAFRCPCGCGREGFLPIGQGKAVSWEWDGNRTRPTLTPSIRQRGGCGWHGWLAAGVWLPC